MPYKPTYTHYRNFHNFLPHLVVSIIVYNRLFIRNYHLFQVDYDLSIQSNMLLINAIK